ncbi:MAG: hypothetical protein FD169_1717 [Bacillota bacterium]|nr:MAG: hypothetical protein FD169_1717 [Bacillota bacterium]MBS3949859.1 DUF445 family protein [Peptococcaceae bacterium]
MPFTYILIPLIGGLIGWVTNVLAIRLLFRPLKPLRVGPFVVHGLIPKRRSEIAAAVADTVANELVEIGGLLKQVTTPEVQHELTKSIMRVVEIRSKERMPSFLPEAIRILIMDFLCKLVEEELTTNFPSFLSQVVDTLKGKIDVRAMVIERIEAMDLDKIESMILGLASRELKAIEYLGGVLGFLIGLVQLGFVVLV